MMDERTFWQTYRPTTPRQQAAAQVLQELALFTTLAPYDPLLIGTVPLDVDTCQSDLDVACHAPDLDTLGHVLVRAYGPYPDFELVRKRVRGVASAIGRFTWGGFAIEVFGQPLPVWAQYGVRHFLVEARLLALGGDPLRQAVRALKEAGVRTEPAFAQLLGLRGDPYERLWTLSFASTETLAHLLAQAGWAILGPPDIADR